MKTDSAIMTEIAQQSSLLRQLTTDESKALKRVLVDMFSDLDRLCREHGLDLILVGGSALGAARHKGFIPWDDDLDVALSRNHYDKLIKLLENGALGNKYEFTCPSKKKDSKNLFLKVFLKNTTNVEIMDLYSPFPKGIYLDVFPIENAKRPGLLNTLKSFCSRAISFVSVSVLYRQYRSKEYRLFMYQSKEGERRYRLRAVLGFLGSVISHRHWVRIFDNYVKSNRDTGYVTIPTGRKGYAGETLSKEVIFPIGYTEFEGIIVKVPGKLDKYLKNLYGDYMTIPPENKRERHYVVKFSLHE